LPGRLEGFQRQAANDMAHPADTAPPGRGGSFAPAIAGLVGNLGLTPEQAEGLCAPGEALDQYEPRQAIAAGASDRAHLIVSGWACEMRVLASDRRQIFAFLMPGDLSIPPANRSRPAFAVMALTALECRTLGEPTSSNAFVLKTALGAARRRNEALRYDALLRMGHLTALTRTVHLLLELHRRMLTNGTARGDTFDLPLTQGQMADALGLSLVQLHRSLAILRRQSLIRQDVQTLTLLRPERLELLVADYE
jgi:CRP-like cAMP-binding protein